MRRIVIGMSVLLGLLIAGCSVSGDSPDERDRDHNWLGNETTTTGNERSDGQKTGDLLRAKFGMNFDVPDDPPPLPGFPPLPAAQKIERHVAVGVNAGPRVVEQKAIEVARPQPQPAAVPFIRADLKDNAADKKRQQPAVPALLPNAGAPPRKRASGLDWYTSIPAALKDASASPGGGKPVMCFRVLGDVTGFM